MSFRQDGNEICVKYEQQKLVVKAIRDDIVNIFVPYRTKEHYSKAIAGEIMRMPGLPKEPQALHIDIVNGEIEGLS